MRCLLSFLLLLFCQLTFAQGFRVKGFEQSMNDGSAFHAPMDAEGHPCGLIKVRTNNPDLQFKGDVVGNVENKMNEYWVYMSPRAQLLKVFHPNYMPLVIPFSDYGIDISSKATYMLTLEETKYKKEKVGVTFIVKPENADLYIDDILIDNMSGNGYYQMYLPKGEHVCKLSKAGYRPNVQIVQTGKSSQNISVELESVMAELEVKCKTATAEIFIDNELKGNGKWKGNLLAGEHKIEARQQNFNSHSQTVMLSEKEIKAIVLPELKRSMGKLQIETEPSNLPVIVDGKSVGSSPCTIDIESGRHYVSCKTYGCITSRSDIEINSDETKTATLMIKYEDGYLKDYYEGAYNGNLNSVLDLVCEAGYRGDYEQAFFWINRHPNKDYIVKHWYSYWHDKNGDEIHFRWTFSWIELYSKAGCPEKALELYPIAKSEEESRGGLFMSDLYMSYIGDAFFKKKEYDKAIMCFEKADRYGLEGLGDCYVAKGYKQLAATYYKKCLNLDYYDEKKRVEKKLKELGY